jgi:monoamine oxidase
VAGVAVIIRISKRSAAMFRSEAMRRLARLMHVALLCERRGIGAGHALELVREAEERDWSRREFLRASAGAAAAASLGLAGRAVAGPVRGSPRIAVVGAGLAGLVCADTLLRRYGLSATVYEAHATRIGGRCFSLRGLVSGKVAENGGEFIDTTHKTMRAYANEFNLAREDVGRAPGEVAYFFDPQRYTDEEVVEEYRQLVGRMRPDLQASSGEPTFFAHNAVDVRLDQISLAEYLEMRASDLKVVRAAISEAYVAEYGLEPAEQSCLNMLLFLHLDKRRRFTPFGVFSDERFHLVGGNDAIATNIAARLPEPVQMGMKLTGLGMNSAGEYELEFHGSATRVADTVVLTLPFTVLRQVKLEPSLGLSVDKQRAIDALGYGTNAKTMIAFHGKPWLTGSGSNGSAYTDLANVQTTWETSPMTPGAVSILTDYAGGKRGAELAPGSVQEQVAAFLADLERVYPGVSGAAVRNGGQFVAHLEHWPSNPLAQGSYTCYLRGQFTSVAGLEGQAAGRLKFAGEHTDSFYSWQGFMEGACLSGIRAAEEIVADIRAGVFS